MATRTRNKKPEQRSPIPAQPRTSEKDSLIKANMQRIFDALHNYPIDKSDAGRALSFKLALPGLGSMTEIKAFIGHVAQGIAMGIFTGREGSQLLYAAQIAMGALRGGTTAPERKKR